MVKGRCLVELSARNERRKNRGETRLLRIRLDAVVGRLISKRNVDNYFSITRRLDLNSRQRMVVDAKEEGTASSLSLSLSLDGNEIYYAAPTIYYR